MENWIIPGTTISGAKDSFSAAICSFYIGLHPAYGFAELFLQPVQPISGSYSLTRMLPIYENCIFTCKNICVSFGNLL